MTSAKGKTNRVTQRDIAEAVGVSHVAVSHVLHRSHKARISPETRDEILRVARSMGYEPRSATTHTIALVVEPQTIWTDVVTNVLMAADELLKENGYRMSITTLTGDSMSEALELFNQKTVDGVIFTDWYGKTSQCLQKLKVPWLLLSDTVGLSPSIDQVALDTVAATRQMTEYLLSKGHRRVMLMNGPRGVGFHDRVVEGASAAMKAAGLPSGNLSTIYDDGGPEIERALVEHLKGKSRPTAVLAASPGGALVVLNRLQKHGFNVPGDVSVVSLIDSPRLSSLSPQVTASTAVGFATVKIAIERLLAQIEGGDWKPERVATVGEIIERESVALLS